MNNTNNYGAVKASPYAGFNTTVPGIGPGGWDKRELTRVQEHAARCVRSTVTTRTEAETLTTAAGKFGWDARIAVQCAVDPLNTKLAHLHADSAYNNARIAWHFAQQVR